MGNGDGVVSEEDVVKDKFNTHRLYSTIRLTRPESVSYENNVYLLQGDFLNRIKILKVKLK